MTLRNLLGLRPKDRSAATLRAAQAEAEAELARARAAAATLEDGRAAALLDAPPAKAERAEAELAAAYAAAERLAVVVAELRRRAEEAQRADRAAALGARRAAFEREAVALIAELRDRYPGIAAELVRLAARDAALEAESYLLGPALETGAREGLDVVATLPAMPVARLGGMGSWSAAPVLPTPDVMSRVWPPVR